ncbi:uncharacterized protein LAESUDRAFT_759743 [Laetiporus sulphureus 93-53]|uniref:RRM domain-containing protein n=1 Tax=Laetiporus sulphureus 93-53 TaxID=1314785 RepID=A0A165DXR0_9APHY|nr:uncharacterized protein LAESUDRAFT_759743 [Laetiporus sulphureus 93-53]KZT05836.1 hypothetical protein LAESUDRAFT_759743 [Laetiporus sulphureus 93-53]
MSALQKLTKKQKKALAFRDRKGKGKAKAFDEDNVVPVDETQDLVDDSMESQAPDSRMEGQAGHGKPSAAREPKMDEVLGSHKSTKKRKREDGNAVEDEKKPTQERKRRKEAVKDGESKEVGLEAVDDGEEMTEGKHKAKQRYILFVGNLRYTTSKEAVQKHFAACDPPPTVRLMTPKPSVTGKTTAKSKGFAFLEFPSKNGLQQALKLHQSELNGRMINVELTAGGGGKSENRLEKLKKRNRELHEQRRKRLVKEKGTTKDADEDIRMPRPQRYSATSGVDQAPSKIRTWSVGETTEVASKRGKKSKKRPSQSLGTGVNAIPVG